MYTYYHLHYVSFFFTCGFPLETLSVAPSLLLYKHWISFNTACSIIKQKSHFLSISPCPLTCPLQWMQLHLLVLLRRCLTVNSSCRWARGMVRRGRDPSGRSLPWCRWSSSCQLSRAYLVDTAHRGLKALMRGMTAWDGLGGGGVVVAAGAYWAAAWAEKWRRLWLRICTLRLGRVSNCHCRRHKPSRPGPWWLSGSCLESFCLQYVCLRWKLERLFYIKELLHYCVFVWSIGQSMIL